MSASDKNISVHFAVYEPYESLPECAIELGSISYTDLDKFMSEIETSESTKCACIKRLYAEYTESASLTGMRSNRHRRLELTGMFGFHKRVLSCAKRMKATDNEIQLTHMCAKNMAAGRCQDEFMRRTLGTTLFPQFYGKDKQK